MLILTIILVIIGSATLVAMFLTETDKERFISWLKNLLTYRPKRFVTYPIYWLNSRRCFYCAKVYWGESKQANERGYVYVMKKRNFLRDIRLRFIRPSETVDPRKLGVIQTLAVYRVYRGSKPDWVDDRFIVLDELLPESIPMFTWEGYHTWYSGGINYQNEPMLLGCRFQIPILRFHSDRSGEPKEPDWHQETIRLFPHSSRLSTNIELKLRDFKRKHRVNFKCRPSFDKPWKGIVEWEIEEISED